MQNTHCWIRFITYAALRVSCRVSTSYNTGRMKKEVGKVFSRITEAVQRGKDYIYLYFKPGSSPFGGVSAVCEYVFTQNSAIWTFYKRIHTHKHTQTHTLHTLHTYIHTYIHITWNLEVRSKKLEVRSKKLEVRS